MPNPFIPLEKANIAIIDGRVSENVVNNLEKLNIKVVRTIKCSDLEESVSYHPDIIMHPIDHKTLIIAPNVYDYYSEELRKLGINAIKGDAFLKKEYPYDIAYNVARLKNIAIHNFKFTDEKLKFHLKKQKLEFIHVNQGYTKCSLMIIDDISAITADRVIYEKLLNLKYNVLLIEAGFVKLEGQKYGFIGGSSGNYSRDFIFVSGKFNHHPDRFRIEEFIKNREKEIIYLSKSEIEDLGTIITLNNC